MKTIIIAEAGVNHNGDIKLAKKLIDIADESGADFVKFQTFNTELLVSKGAQKSEYQKINTKDADDSQFKMLKNLELSDEDHIELYNYCKGKRIKFISSPFDDRSISFLNDLGIELFKVPSGEITNFPYLKKIAQCKKPIVLSTGMATIEEIQNAVSLFENEGVNKKEITVLHCNSDYPTKLEDVNLRAMLDIKETFDINIGYSDHTLGIEVSLAAVALGAKVIEKHFTIDPLMAGPDHKASLGPNELNQLVSSIRAIEKSMSGSGKKIPTESELKNKINARKSIHYQYNLKKNHIIQETDIVMLRPGNGVSPIHFEKFIGKKLTNDVLKFDMLNESDF
jgi:N,N'-diacetyllegionaminate synthase